MSTSTSTSTNGQLLSSQFLAKLCYNIDSNFGKIDIHTKLISTLMNTDISNLTVDIIEKNNVELMIYRFSYRYKYIQLIGFKSSDSDEDWKSNYDIIPISIDGKSCCDCASSPIKVHKGFFNQFNTIKDELISKLDTSDIYTTIFTGFSLGGALATLSALLINQIERNINLITFGAPKIGNKAFVNMINTSTKIKRIERWIYNNDPVPRLPPGFYYKHINGLKQIDEDGNISETELCCYCKWLNTESKNDHSLAYYIENISPFNTKLY